jgi:hypothetical protein
MGKDGRKLPLSQLIVFISVCSRIKKQILLLYNSKQSPADVPPLLPPTTRAFLATACSMTEDDDKRCCGAVGELIWKGDEHLESMKGGRCTQENVFVIRKAVAELVIEHSVVRLTICA